MARHLSLVAALLIRELDYALHDTLLLAVVACDVKDDGITGLETADDALEVRERRDRNTIDARDDFAFAHGLRTGIGGDSVRVNILDEQPAYAREMSFVDDLRRDLCERQPQAKSIAAAATAPRRVVLLRQGRVVQVARRKRARTLADRYLHGAALHLAADITKESDRNGLADGRGRDLVDQVLGGRKSTRLNSS